MAAPIAAPTTFTAELFARDLAELLDHVGWQQRGGRRLLDGRLRRAGVRRALSASGRPALGLIDTTAWYGPEAPAKFRERAAAARAKGMRGLIDFQVDRWFSDAFRAAASGGA